METTIRLGVFPWQHDAGSIGPMPPAGPVHDAELWHAWKHAAEAVWHRVGADITTVTGLSDGDFGIVTRIADAPGRSLRQNQLAVSMGWHRSRLSRHLARMQTRGLIERSPAEDGMAVTLTEHGVRAAAAARPVHARAIHEHLAGRLSAAERGQLLALLAKLTD